MARKNSITFNDIAKYTGFSKTTISRYFNNPDTVLPDNQKIIADALDKLGYSENKVAKVLANGKTEFIGIIVPDLYHKFYAEVLTEILSTYREFGYKFLVFNGSRSEDKERQYIDELMAYKIEGLLILSHTVPSSELAALGIPAVAIEREDLYISSVNTDNYQGAVQATNLLADSGAEVLIHINSFISPDLPSHKRVTGFVDASEERNIPNEIFYLSESRVSIDELISKLKDVFDIIELKYSGKRKGIFLSSDTYANAFLNLVVRKHGTLPDDYRICGFDNTTTSADAIIPITTVGQNTKELAHEAISLLQDQITNSKKQIKSTSPAPIHRTIDPELIIRETT